jgi:hypothetical protein
MHHRCVHRAPAADRGTPSWRIEDAFKTHDRALAYAQTLCGVCVSNGTTILRHGLAEILAITDCS